MAVEESGFLSTEGRHGQAGVGDHGQSGGGNPLAALTQRSMHRAVLLQKQSGSLTRLVSILAQKTLGGQGVPGVACGYPQIYPTQGSTQRLWLRSVVGIETTFVGALTWKGTESHETVSQTHHYHSAPLQNTHRHQ